MPKRLTPAAGLARLPNTELVRTYVWEKPVRIAHWLMFFSFVPLSFTGLYMHHPFLLAAGSGSFLMAKMRFVHVLSGFVLIAAMLLRLYWFFRGNFWAKWSSYLPIHRAQWTGIMDMLEFYLFLRFTPGRRVGHNPLAALSYAVIYALILLEIFTGIALFSQVLGNPVLHWFVAWTAPAQSVSYFRLIHYFLTFVFFAFVIFHVYASVLVSQQEENGLLDSIFSGWKFVPAGELRHEIAAIPEARRFAKRHDLLPHGTREEGQAGAPPKPRPGPGPITLYRNGISYIGTSIVAVGALVFLVLTAYHTVGGGALTQPYGDLVIFFVPPVFVFAGVAVILLGMYVQWIRWRMHKPLSFARYPKWDLNVAAERKALLGVAIGAAVISLPALYGSGQAYVYTDAVPFCGAVCHSMSPEYVTYQRSPHARVTCAQCHVGPGPLGYLASKVRGVTELVETVDGDFPRPIPLPVNVLRPIRGNCEECHWPTHLTGSREAHFVHFLSDEQNTRWEIDMLIQVGGGSPSEGPRTGAHWHVTSKVEYIAGDPDQKTIPWVRSVDFKTGAAKVYSAQEGQPSAVPPAGEIRTMDCVDCHNRPSHKFQAPDRSVDIAIADHQMDASLPFLKQQSVLALTASYANSDEARRGIAASLRGYYQKNYPRIASSQRPAIDAAVTQLQTVYERSFFPEMKIRWDTYAPHDNHLNSAGCFRCHDGQHKSADGAAIRSDCDLCHRIVRQGKAGAVQFAAETRSLPFEHPVDIGDIWQTQACSSCHTGGAQ